MKKLVILATSTLLMTGCAAEVSSSSQPAPQPTTQPAIQYTVSDSEKQMPLDIKEFKYEISDNRIRYAVHVYNPNSKLYAYLPSWRVTARDINGQVIGTEDSGTIYIPPAEDSYAYCTGPKLSETPETVEIELLDDTFFREMPEYSELAPLELQGVALRDGRLTGELVNNNDCDFSTVYLTVVTKDDQGELKYTSILNEGQVQNVKANSTTPFDIDVYDLEGCTYDIQIMPWK